MMHSDIRKAHERIAALRDALFEGGPDEIERCLPELEESAAALRALQAETLPQQWSDLQRSDLQRSDLQSLRKELNRAARLIESGDRLWRGWARMLGSVTGYTSAGEPVSLGASGQVSVRG